MYHRFGESKYPSTNIRIDQFEAHIAELTSGRYVVMPLIDMVQALRRRAPLPDRAVAITIDDAVRSVYTEGWPRFRRANLPFTLFVATKDLEQKSSLYMNWDQVRELAQAGVTIGSHTVSHPHLPELSPEAQRAEIATAQDRFVRELGQPPQLFAYPYGEANGQSLRLARELGFAAAFGQHSGVLHESLDLFYLPRFALNENWGEPDRVRMVLNALPLPIERVAPAEPTLEGNPPGFVLEVGPSIANLASLRCYASADGGRFARTGERRFEMTFAAPLAAGRARINCTVPAEGGRFRWFSMQYYVPGASQTEVPR
jgi:peptidoglycan/xylan/chitin deacetylase (PgdA/CDA1 family)